YLQARGLLLPSLPLSVSLFFFFQAEDGIRDATVTGVQTCALPISKLDCEEALRLEPKDPHAIKLGELLKKKQVGSGVCWCKDPRSEERRVGKECRSRWSA